MPDAIDFSPRLKHAGIFVKDLEAMTEFYCKNFGMIVTDSGMGASGKNYTRRPGAFLSADPTEHHQLALISGRDPEAPGTVAQISFLLDSLTALKAFYQHVLATGIPVEVIKNHGNAWSVYVNDPDGNFVEVYVHSPYYIPQPGSYPLDLDKSEQEILRETDEIAAKDPGARPREEWIAEMAQKMEAAKVRLAH
ncbi:VOC family protein [Streptomyces sp. NPDC058221]|uniref:VOC family protein n=1 Tax=Streptomyces sp. NPDC058221 TaxID=3346388 RepID=UPI0036E7F510